MAEGDTVVNALIGGIVAIILSFVPFSPVLGGALSGYLEGGTRNKGAWVGALAGLVAFVPLVFVFGVIGMFGIVSAGAGGLRPLGGVEDER